MRPVDLRSARNTLADLAYDRILNAILSFELQPGDRLNAAELASALSISRTPVERALSRLHGEGLVEIRPTQGSFVRELREEDISEVFDSRLMCEVWAIEKGIHEVNPDFLAQAEHLALQYERQLGPPTEGEEDRVDRVTDYDLSFHRHLVSLVPSSRTREWYRQLNYRLVASRLLQSIGNPPFRREEIPGEHRAVIRALAQGDAQAAVQAVTHHVLTTRDALVQLLQASSEGSNYRRLVPETQLADGGRSGELPEGRRGGDEGGGFQQLTR